LSSFISSPVWGAIISVAGAALVGLVAMLSRVLGKVSRIEEKMGELASDVSDIKQDRNIMRWSDIARDRRRHRRHGF
jgi:hypothetical protein